MNQSEHIGQLAEALSKAQGMIKGATKDNNNPFFKSKYADLSSVWEACREALSKNNISITQLTDISENGTLSLVTTLMHSSGEWQKGYYPIKPVKDDPQGVGSAITYARRYSLAAAVGVAPEDDDGEAAMGRKNKPIVTVKKEDERSFIDACLESIESNTIEAFLSEWNRHGKDEQVALWGLLGSKERSCLKKLQASS